MCDFCHWLSRHRWVCGNYHKYILDILVRNRVHPWSRWNLPCSVFTHTNDQCCERTHCFPVLSSPNYVWFALILPIYFPVSRFVTAQCEPCCTVSWHILPPMCQQSVWFSANMTLCGQCCEFVSSNHTKIHCPVPKSVPSSVGFCCTVSGHILLLIL